MNVLLSLVVSFSSNTMVGLDQLCELIHSIIEYKAVVMAGLYSGCLAASSCNSSYLYIENVHYTRCCHWQGPIL